MPQDATGSHGLTDLAFSKADSALGWNFSNSAEADAYQNEEFPYTSDEDDPFQENAASNPSNIEEFHHYDSVYESTPQTFTGAGEGAGEEVVHDIPTHWLNRLMPHTELLRDNDWQSVFTRIYFIDDHGVFRPFDMERVLAGEKTQLGDLSGMPYNTAEILQQFTTLPLSRIHHYANTGEYMRALFDNKKLIDVLIHIGAQIFAAHRIALACHSVYFARAFILNQHQKHNLTEVRLKAVDPKTFYVVLKFIYTGTLFVNSENVDSLMSVANRLQIPAVLFKCLDFMGQMPLKMAVDVFRPNVALINQQVQSLLAFPLLHIMNADHFLELGIEAVEKLLGHDDLLMGVEAVESFSGTTT